MGVRAGFVSPTSDRALEGREYRKGGHPVQNKVLRARHSTVSAVRRARTALHTRRKEPEQGQAG